MVSKGPKQSNSLKHKSLLELKQDSKANIKTKT
jgi:hypothetical protein